jgi:predicted nucleotidyltransferase component of viral defense system
MMKNTQFLEQARLIMRVLPYISAEECFALKGGTAINYFIRDFPRLSVDIDLTYLPIEPRDASLRKIWEAFCRIRDSITRGLPGAKITFTGDSSRQHIGKLYVGYQGVQIKIEANEVIRGTVFEAEERDLTPKVEDRFQLAVRMRILSIADLYGGKLCAFLDRQHPRDIFDIKLLMDSDGITENIRKAFVIYLACHDRPMHEILNPKWQDITQKYQNEFDGMTTTPISYEELAEVRTTVLATLRSSLSDQEKRFLLSVKAGTPEWDCMGIQGIDRLPALQWKILNIVRMDKKKHGEMLDKLQKLLEV